MQIKKPQMRWTKKERQVSLIFTNFTFNIKCSFLFLISSLVVKVFNSTIKRHEMIKQKVSILKYHPNKMLLLLVLVGLSLLSALSTHFELYFPTCSYSKCQAQVQFLTTQLPQPSQKRVIWTDTMHFNGHYKVLESWAYWLKIYFLYTMYKTCELQST